MTVGADAPFTAEELEPTLRPLLEASLLPQRAYVDESVADWEARNFFLGGWICVGHVSAFAERGQYVTVEVAGESLLFVGERGFYNVCRHRAARLLSEREGTTRRLQCPYHAWSYGFDGTLKNAPHTQDLEGFDKACHGLREVRTETIGGLLFADPSGEAGSLADHVGSLADQLDRYRIGGAQARRPDRLRRQGQLEGDRRELLRVPALPGRPPRAQPPQPLPDRRRRRGPPAPGAAAR